MPNAYEQLKSDHQLPSPTGVALEVLRLTELPESDINALSDLIRCDPALSAQLLRLVNSSSMGQAREVGSIDRAIVLLGFRSVATLSLGLSLVSSNRKGGCTAFDYDRYWSNSLARAVAAQQAARVLRIVPTDEAFTCGLLANIGELAFATAFPEGYGRILHWAAADDTPVAELELKKLGLDHFQLAAAMMNDWNLPEAFSDAVASLSPAHGSAPVEGDPGFKLWRLLGLAERFVDVITEPLVERSAMTHLSTVAYEFGIAPDQLPDVFEAITESWREAGNIFTIPTRQVLSLSEIYSRCVRHREVIEDSENVEHE